MTVLGTKLLATPAVSSFPAGGTPWLELCNRNQFSFLILLFWLLQISGVAVSLQWCSPEKRQPIFPLQLCSSWEAAAQ